MSVQPQHCNLFSSLAARASTFDDRIRRGAFLPQAACGDATAQRRVQAWREVLSAREGVLEKRFGWDGISLEAVARAVGEPLVGEEGVTPSWLRALREAYGEGAEGMRARFAECSVASDRVHDPDRPVPFGVLFVPLVRWARERLMERTPAEYPLLHDTAHLTLERCLMHRLSQVCGRMVYADFSVYRSCQPVWLGLLGGGSGVFDGYLAEMAGGRLWTLFRQHSVAARLCGVVAGLWVDAVAEFLRRLSADLPDLERELGGPGPLGRVESVSADLSDPHEGGRSVIIPRFESGVRVVYKPRPVGLDDFFARCLRWLDRTGEVPTMRTLRVLPRGEYGWIEFAEHLPCQTEEEVRRYYRRCGVLLCLVYAINGSDFHAENIIASGEHPVLIDMEALLGHRFKLDTVTNRNPGTSNRTQDCFEESVLKVGLLPLLKLDRRGYATDIGGIGGAIDLEDTVEVPHWVGINSDAMKIGYRQLRVRQRANNRVRLSDREIDPAAYAGDIVEGFRQAYGALLAHGGELLGRGGMFEELKSQPVRFIFRNTSLYASILQRTLHPRFLRDGAERSIQLDVLSRPLLSLEDRPHIWPILAAEREALEQMDVPMFVAPADSVDLPLPGGDAIPGFFHRSAYDEALERFRSLGGSDLERQCGLIVAAFAANEARGCHSLGSGTSATLAPGGELDPARAVRAARGIAALLESRARSMGDDGVAWYAIQYVPHARRHRVDVGNFSLHDGSGGIAVFLAALEGFAPGAGYGDLALAAMSSFRRGLPELGRYVSERSEVDLGGGTGIGSGIYALVRIADSLARPELLADALQLSRLLEPEVFARDRAFDVISGSAGAILSLLALYRATGDKEVLARAAHAGEHLLQARVLDEATGHRVWHTWKGQAETGFAHGMAGIACALQRLAAALGEAGAPLAEAASEAIRFERERLGPDLRAEGAEHRSGAWSYGAAGIGLARLGGARLPESAPGRGDVEAALRITVEQLLSGSDTLACGVLGRAEYLLCAGQRLGQPELVGLARRAAGSVLDRGAAQGYDTGWHAGYQDPALFHGLAGIGYQLLRISHPDRLPSLLLWE